MFTLGKNPELADGVNDERKCSLLFCAFGCNVNKFFIAILEYLLFYIAELNRFFTKTNTFLPSVGQCVTVINNAVLTPKP